MLQVDGLDGEVQGLSYIQREEGRGYLMTKPTQIEFNRQIVLSMSVCEVGDVVTLEFTDKCIKFVRVE